MDEGVRCMTSLRKRMLEELQLCNLSQNTTHQYLGVVKRFALHFGKSPDQLGPDHIRQFLLHLINEKHRARNTIQAYRGALRFLYQKVLKQSWFDTQIAVPKRRLQLPAVLSPDEITRILDHTVNLKHWTLMATLYATALRCQELPHLKVSDIDSKRMILHIQETKGGVPRDIGLSAPLLERLRIYYRWQKPKEWLFPSHQHPDRPLDDGSIRHICRQAGRRAGIPRLVHPHIFRHYLPSRIMSCRHSVAFIFGPLRDSAAT